MIPTTPPKKYLGPQVKLTKLTIPGDPNGDLLARRATDPHFGNRECFESFWELQPGEIEGLKNGHPVILKIYGQQHPVVALCVSSEPPEANE